MSSVANTLLVPSVTLTVPSACMVNVKSAVHMVKSMISIPPVSMMVSTPQPSANMYVSGPPSPLRRSSPDFPIRILYPSLPVSSSLPGVPSILSRPTQLKALATIPLSSVNETVSSLSSEKVISNWLCLPTIRLMFRILLVPVAVAFLKSTFTSPV